MKRRQFWILLVFAIVISLGQMPVGAAEANLRWNALRLPDRPWALQMDLKEFTITKRLEEKDQALLKARSITLTSEVVLEIASIADQEQTLLDYAKERWERMRLEITGYPDNIRLEESDGSVTVTYSIAMPGEESKITKGFVIFEKFDNAWICARLEKHNFRLTYQKAVEDLMNTITIRRFYHGTDDSDEARGLRSILLLTDQDMDTIKTNLEQLVKTYPSNSFSWFLMGDLYRTSKRPEDASQAYQRALDQELSRPLLTPELLRLLITRMAQNEIELGRFKQAENVYQQGIKLDPDAPCYYYEYACFLSGRGKIDKALEMLDQACRKALFYPGEKIPRPDKDTAFDGLKNNAKFQMILNKYASLFVE